MSNAGFEPAPHVTKCYQTICHNSIHKLVMLIKSYLTIPADVLGMDNVTGMDICDCSFNTAMLR